MTNSKVTLGIFLTIFFIASCSSVQKSSETITDEGVRGVSISSGERSTSEQAVLANATVYFEYDSYRLSSKSLQTLKSCLLYTSPSPRDQRGSRMPSSA